MTISTQQTQSVLWYNRQLKLSRVNRSVKSTPPQPKKDNITISIEGTRQRIYQQATNHIVEKLTKNNNVA